MTNRLFITATICVGIILSIWYILYRREGQNTPVTCARCNVVFIDIDILRYDALNCSDEHTITPNICRLIRNSNYFTHNISQSYWTLPSSLSTVTSLYPNKHKVWQMENGTIPSSYTTIAELLAAQGYHTYYFGVEGDSMLSIRNGGLRGYQQLELNDISPAFWLENFTAAYHTQPVFFHVYTAYLHLPYLLDVGQEPLYNLPKPAGLPLRRDAFDVLWSAYVASHYQEIFTEETIRSRPDIFRLSPPLREKRIVDYFNQLDAEHDYTKRLVAWDTYYQTYMQFIHPDSPADRAYLRMLYDTKLHTLDAELGPFISSLLDTDVAKNTIIVFSSAHGESFGENGMFSHEPSPFNTLFHVPLAIRFPGALGKRIEGISENIDIVPTIIDLLGLGVLPQAQGTSLVPLMRGADRVKSVAVSMNDGRTYIIQSNKYALIASKDRLHPDELYDLKSDPQEEHDIAPIFPFVAKYFRKLLIQRAAPELQTQEDRPPFPTWLDREKIIKGGYF